MLVKDKVIEGYARTSATPPGQRGDAYYLERIAAATLINEATTLYNQERYVEALGQYRSALAMPTGEQLRVVNGIYLPARSSAAPPRPSRRSAASSRSASPTTSSA